MGRAAANLECSPPTLALSYDFKLGTTAGAQAGFVARLGEVKARAAVILQGATRLSALVDGKIDGRVVLSDPPLRRLFDAMTGFASADALGNFDIPVGRLPSTIAAQAKFVAFLTNPT
jgi:hypothetical protein